MPSAPLSPLYGPSPPYRAPRKVSYLDESRRENTPPLQMLTREQLLHINVPTRAVLSQFAVLVIEALALGVLISDEEHYYMVTPDEWKRRKMAETTQAQGGYVSLEDRQAGSNRTMGTILREVMSRLGEKLPEEARTARDQTVYEDLVVQQVSLRQSSIERNLRCDLFQALYFEGYVGTSRERIDLETTIRPALVFILRRDFALDERHIHRPNLSHQELLRSIYLA